MIKNVFWSPWDDPGLEHLRLAQDEGLFQGFTAELPTDPDGLMLDYPGLFRRIWSD